MINSINSIFSTCSIYRIGESEFGSIGNFLLIVLAFHYNRIRANKDKGSSYIGYKLIGIRVLDNDNLKRKYI